MNAAFLIMTSAALAGADPAPPPPPPAAPVVVSGAGCNNCAPAPGCCGSKTGFLDRLRGRLGGGLFKKKGHDCCAPAPCPAPCPPPCPKPAPCPAPCPPAPCVKPAPCPAPAPCHACPTSVACRPNLLDTLKSRMGHKKKSCCAPSCDPCGAAHLMPAPGPGPVTPPKEMPKGKDEKPKGGNTGAIPQPFPSVPAGVTGSPY